MIVYLVKVILLSGLLFAYYRLFLRDRTFHRFNRWYLLTTIPASLLLPLIPLPSLAPGWNSPTLPVVLHAIKPGSWNETDPSAPIAMASQSWWPVTILLIYIVTTLFFAYGFIRQLAYVRHLPSKYNRQQHDNISFFVTEEPGAPFSFLKNIFWAQNLDLSTPEGQQILEHELYHVRQNHTHDLLLIRPLLIAFWFNPFFHLLYREIRTIHEFQADAHAASIGSRLQYAEMLVWQTIRQPSSILHPFFQSPIKRRITMITKLTSKSPGYGSRLMVLPMLFLLLCAFASSIRPPHPASPKTSTPFLVVIDPGHGGSDAGAIHENLQEKDLNLALALKVKQLSAAYHVDVVLTRSKDELSGGSNSIKQSLVYRTDFAKEQHANLFVSLHVGNDNKGIQNGLEIYISPDNAHYQQCVQAGSDMIESLKSTYTTLETIKQRQEGIYILKNAAMPSILVSCGNIANAGDRRFITDEQNQEKLARDILEGIVRYQNQQSAQ